MSAHINILILISIFFSAEAFSKEKENKYVPTSNSYCNSLSKTRICKSKFINNSIDYFNKAVEWFNKTDTSFVLPNKYNLTLMLEQSTWFEHYHLRSNNNDGDQILGFAPQANTKIGLYFGWRWIFLGYSFDMGNILNSENKKPRTEIVFNFYNAKFGLDVYYRKTGNDFKIIKCKNFDISDDYIGTNFRGFNSYIKGLNAYYIFKSNKYSYPAAYGHSTNQIRSCGSPMIGFAYSQHEINFDKSKLPTEIQEQIKPSLNFKSLSYTDYNLSIGYGYNWVFAKNCLLNLSLLPAIGYKKAKINDLPATTDSNWTQWVKDINFDLITRAGITWNNGKHYVGATLILHTYDYRKDNLSMTNSFGCLKVYAGFNFWKRK